MVYKESENTALVVAIVRSDEKHSVTFYLPNIVPTPFAARI